MKDGKRKLRFAAVAILLLAPLSGAADQEAKAAPGKWDPDGGLGNHRAVVRVEAPASAGPLRSVRAVIPWHRRDADPEKKNIIVVDAATGARIANVFPLAVNRESGDIVFEPSTVPGDYHIYYMPYKLGGSKYYPEAVYEPHAATAEQGWLAGVGLGAETGRSDAAGRLPRALFIRTESFEPFGSFSPMESAAAADETARLLAAHREPYLVFPEDRRFSIRMTDALPLRWIEAGPGRALKAEAARGEYLSFQLGLWAARTAMKNVAVEFSDLVAPAAAVKPRSPKSAVIPSPLVSCLNLGGVDWDGLSFRKDVSVEKGRVQALWCGVAVPEDAVPGLYEGTATVRAEGLPERTVVISIRVKDEAIASSGDDDPYRMARLRWLNSRLAFDDGIVKPFIPLEVSGRRVKCLGRVVELGKLGFPVRITSNFPQTMTSVGGASLELLAAPFELQTIDANGKALDWKPSGGGPSFVKRTAGAVVWETANAASGLEMQVRAMMEFDGFVGYQVTLKAVKDVELSDIRLVVPFRPEAARMMMGLGFKGGVRPGTFEWSWDVSKNQDALWLGTVNGGLQVQLRAENYSRPLNTNFYLSKPLKMPPSWSNGGKGGVKVEGGRTAGEVLFRAFSGARRMKAGEHLGFDFNLLITPFKPIDPKRQFRERYFHAFKPLDEIAGTEANIINVHHATDINPYINYPFLRPDLMKAYIDDAHGRGLKVKIYYTIRELSNRAPELFALRSLGHEIFSPGKGGGYSWLQEHLGSDYIAAWFVPSLRDAAIINSGMSRWHNYYIEGLDWLARNVGIDGLYLDDVAFDRTTMKRVRKVLERRRPEPRLDLHSANQYNVRDGFASSANLYLEHFPYLDRLWFGEYFDYGSRPDYWLVEMSGIPFGLMGEMLQDGGNPWRGMAFGMTSRLPWAGDPRPLWKAWDEFGLTESDMIGWWVDWNPVKTGNSDVLATSYVRKGAAGRTTVMIALAGWNGSPADIRLTIDWKALGLDPSKAMLRAPVISGFQEAAEFRPGDAIRIEPGKGRLLVLGE